MLSEIFKKQNGLEERIKTEFGLKGSDMITGKICSVIVEGAELMNDLDAHKYWKRNKRNKLREAEGEAIDCLHFAIGLILNFGYTLEDIQKVGAKEIECYGYKNININELKGLMRLSAKTFGLGYRGMDKINNQELMTTYLWMCEYSIRILRKRRYKETKETKKGIMKDLYKLLASALGMCHCLGMSHNVVYEKYMNKNAVNVKRQDNKY